MSEKIGLKPAYHYNLKEQVLKNGHIMFAQDVVKDLQIMQRKIRKLTDKPTYETPEQYKERTGKDYPDDFINNVKRMCEIITNNPTVNKELDSIALYVETYLIQNENGKPPVDYRPE